MAEKSIKAAQIQTLINNIKARFFSKSEAQEVGYMGETQEVSRISVDATPTAQSNGLVKSGGVYSAVHPAIQSSIPSGGMLPNVLYNLGTISSNKTMTMASPIDASVPNHYYFTFSMGSTLRTITWDTSITKWYCPFNKAKGGAETDSPILDANKHYEVSVISGVAAVMEV